MRTTSITKKPKSQIEAAPRFAAAAPPWTLEERVHGIQAMAKRIEGYISYMCTIAGTNGTSYEAKDRAVTAFYKQMVVVESQLAKIYDELRLE
ncbi:MAG: hypothetical protein FJ271_25840 [Planctomycetes bacterium]|nr:hypothetical protein [Planctomycetota bacterium]